MSHEDEAGRGRGARRSMGPLQLGENKCIFFYSDFSFNAIPVHYSTGISKQEIIIGIM